MSRMNGPRVTGASSMGRGKWDRPSRLLIFARRNRRSIRPALTCAVLLALAAYGLHVERAMRTEASFAPIRAQIGRLTGLPITRIVIEGRNMTPEGQVLSALGVTRGAPLLGFSVALARARLDQLAFVERSTVERRLPGTVLVRITERRPFAVWQNHDHFVLIDRDGRVVQTHRMSRKDAEAFEVLPLVVGPGAPKAAAALIEALGSVPVVRKQVTAAVRVGQRRWNLVLRGGAEIMLPEGAAPAALSRLAKLETSMRLLERPLTDIDMRLPDRLVIRPKPQQAPLAGAPPADAPDDARRPA